MADALQIFFVPYIISDVPSNVLLKRFAPSTWISMLTFFWVRSCCIACMCQGVVNNTSGLFACRFFMGLCEGGFVPGCAYLLSMYYKRHEFQKRFSLLWAAGLVAGAFGGLLAYALYHMHNLGGDSGWRWVFIIGGLAVNYWTEKAKFLSSEEKEVLEELNACDVGEGARMDRLDGATWRRIISDWEAYYLGITVSGYATALFVPSIVNSLGYSDIESQAHSIPIWAVAAVVMMMDGIFPYRSLATSLRLCYIRCRLCEHWIYHIIVPGLLSRGLNVHVRYMAVFFVTTGYYIAQPPNNLSGNYKRAVGLAIQVGFGNIGGIIASNIFNRDDAPLHTVGYGNKKRDQEKRDDRLQLDEDVLNGLGDDDPRFRFSL
ncbi:major facilitator superfamily domain-containing protein [Aspergillus flavus]|uniref:Major facilitator superfamily domain-containing protein n=1 Tax=Aspergillus flavus (strain ATCC 200026 / FGSC A1120 / IAM 13836 / NRRL 3357 / JCM 12722 / SRRC 167) TaxID=332952 RepID=A0A7U2MDU9_ASPFN|nr:major facilitator superfamily domain-containing protein [Aspergillus flavus]